MSQLEGRDPSQQQTDSQVEMLDLRAYLRPIRRWKWVILLIAILAAGGTYELTSHEKKTYETATLVYVENADPASSIASGVGAVVSPSTTALADIATLFTGQAITDKVYSQLGLPVGSAGSVVVTPSSNSTFITVSASSHSAALAARLANTYVSVFFASQAAAVTTAALADAAATNATLKTIPATGVANQAQRAALLAQIADYKADAYNPSSGAQVIDAAAIPALPTSPKPIRDAVFAGVIGLLLGIGLAFVLDLADRRLVRVSSVESIYDRSVLAVLPHVGNASPRANGSFLTPPAFVEVMRSLRVNIRLAAGDRPLKSLIVTSALPSEGKSTVVRDLAFAYADAGERVLVIDCDLRRPSLARVFGVKPELGLVQVLRREAKPAEATVPVFRTRQVASGGAAGEVMAAGDPRRSGSIDVMAHGERVASPAALLASREMSGLLASSASYYDFVILDTSPILTVTDAVPLLDQVGAVLFVARLGMTTREAAERLTELGKRVPKMHLAGVVVNDMRGSYIDEGHSYSSRYGYEYTRTKG
jgi:non-specific protein-tyrosine kinase